MPKTCTMLVESVVVICPECGAPIIEPTYFSSFWDTSDLDRFLDGQNSRQIICGNCDCPAVIRRPKTVKAEL